MNIATRRSFSSTGSLKELFLLFSPLLLIAFLNYLVLFVEELFLVRFSTKAMEAAISATYARQIFQISFVSLAMMSQVYVGRCYGAQDWKEIGPVIWQFIWFSLFSLFISIPFSLAYGQYYFQGTGLEEIGLPYFYFLASINFLFPLGAVLSCFFIGRGKTRLVLIITIGFQFLKILLSYLLIFGIKSWLPSMGLMGIAFATLISQGGFCLLLLCVFLNKKNNEIFHTRRWKFKLRLFWESIHPGLLRALNRILTAFSWASIAHLMSSKGGDYLLILSIGGTLFLFLPFLGDALCQANTTVVSNLLGAKKHLLLDKAFRTGTILALFAIILVGIPLVFYSSFTFHYLFPLAAFDDVVIHRVFFGVWISFAFFTLSYVPISFILAFKDTKFSLFMGALSWINGYLLMYIVIEKGHIAADQFWLYLAIMHGSSALLYLWRMQWLKSQVVLTTNEASSSI